MSRVVSDWLKGHLQQKPASNVTSISRTEDAVLQSLLSEVETHVRQAERRRRIEEIKLRRRGSLPDYTWLLSSTTERRYEMPSIEKLELSELCSKIKPSDCTTVICNFRKKISENSSSKEIPRLMRRVVVEQVAKQDAEEKIKSAATRRSSLRGLSQSSASKWDNQRRRNSAMPESTQMASSSSADGSNGQRHVFLVERAYSYPMLGLERIEQLPPL